MDIDYFCSRPYSFLSLLKSGQSKAENLFNFFDKNDLKLNGFEIFIIYTAVLTFLEIS